MHTVLRTKHITKMLFIISWLNMPYERRPDMKHNLFTGVIGSLFSMLQFLASPIMGAASDVYGRKPVLVISMVKIHDDNLINIQCINTI